MTDYREQVAQAVAAVAVTSATSFRWFGRPSPPLRRELAAALPPALAREHLAMAMERELYQSFYCQGVPVAENPLAGLAGASDRQFAKALSDANAGRGGWSSGWHVERVEGPTLVVTRDGLRVRVHRRASRLDGVNGSVSLRRGKDHRAAAPGFYSVLSDAPHVIGAHDIEVRVYFHLTPQGAAPLIAAATAELNVDRVPFGLKVVNNPVAFQRCDAAVLYLHRDDFARVRERLLTVAAACREHLRAQTPAFTKRIAPGIGIGEHVAALGSSFGTSRCRLLAEGVLDAYRNGAVDPLNAVARQFAEHGLDIDVPYLAPGSADAYDVI